ncbi:peptide/nickel transport system permease protein [Rhodococcus sp. SMB37]|uniref:ABC transporter permease n=1 Tax=Rhodococcus sp. SMB37 TaxID=2512213 RepID=UPI0010D6BAF5|nr:ABC transporter permease [Rhodococcus sp. SMB37]TCN55940.1 peptide/nickel transport system permease protein [Rhodococcus sp. SMB37]
MSSIDPAAEPELRSRRRPVVKALTRGQGLAGVLLVVVVGVAGLLAPWLAPFDPNQQISGANLLGPSAEHWFGTDTVNRDVFSRVLHGIRINLQIIFIAVPIGAVLGSLLGLVSTMHSALDVVAQRVFDVVLAFPALILAIALAAIVGPGALTVGIVIVVAEIPVFGRNVRTQVLRIRELPFVEASEVIGASRWFTLRAHVLPNATEPLAIQLALSMSVAVFVESAMSFIGIGVRPPEPSLGSIVADAVPNLDINAAFAIGPLAVIAALVLGFLLIAQALGSARRT